MEEPQNPVDPPQEKNPYNRKPTWVREAIQGAERYGAQNKCTQKGREIGPTTDM